MPSEKISFSGSEGHALSAIADRPQGAIRAWALFAHCFTCSKNLRAVINIADALNDAGIAVLRFDFTGLGESEGDFADSNFSGNVGDLVAAARYMQQQGHAPDILIGHSLGGTAVLQAASQIPGAVAVATIAAPSHATHVAALLADDRAQIESSGEATVRIGGRPFRIRKQFLDDLERQDVQHSIAHLRKALLIMHAPLDPIVDIEHASRLFLGARHPKSFVSLDKADHLLSQDRDSRYAGGVIAAWAQRYLPVAQDTRVDALRGDGSETVARTLAGGFLTHLDSAGHQLIADEPLAHGGTNQGPSPFDLLAAALAACTTMTLHMYAQRKKLELQAVSAHVTHSKIHARQCEDCETVDGKVDVFERTIGLSGNLGADERQRLLAIADMCPVHRTLHGEIKVRTTLID